MTQPVALAELLDEWFSSNESGPVEAATSDEPGTSETPARGTNYMIISPDTDIRAQRAEADPTALVDCSLDWCRGHMLQEADTWGELVHQEIQDSAFEADFSLRGGPALGPIARATRLLTSEGAMIYVDVHCERELTQAEALTFALELEAAAVALRARVAA